MQVVTEKNSKKQQKTQSICTFVQGRTSRLGIAIAMAEKLR